MVVNEATSSIQAKGTKTVIAAAIAAVAGSAMAASAYVEAPTKPGDDVAIFDAASSDDKLKAENSFVLTAKDTDTTTPLLSPKDNYTLTADKKIWVTGVGAKAHASGIWMDTADKTATNESTIYVTTGKDGKYYANRAMGVNKGKTLVLNSAVLRMTVQTRPRPQLRITAKFMLANLLRKTAISPRYRSKEETKPPLIKTHSLLGRSSRTKLPARSMLLTPQLLSMTI